MKKIIYIIILFISSTLHSCETVSDKEIILFDGVNRIAFTEDSVKTNLAELPIREKYIIKVPVRIMGFVDREKSRHFDVEVVAGVSNSTYSEPTVNEQYDVLATNYVIEKDSVNGHVEVEFTISAFDPSKVYELRLRVKDNEFFKIGVTEKLISRVIVLNFLEKPDWWDMSGITSEFKVLMLSKLYEVYGKSPISQEMLWDDYMGVMGAFKKVSDWLVENPQYGVTFNDGDKEYFEMFI